MEQRTPRDGISRRKALRLLFLFSGLLASYGTLGAFAAKYLYPGGQKRRQKMFLASAASLPMGESVTLATPKGEKIIITKTQAGVQAFSSRCPHLGCQVFWRAKKQIFHCPCHEGFFDAKGTATAGPPAKEGKNLVPVNIQLEGDSIFAWV